MSSSLRAGRWALAGRLGGERIVEVEREEEVALIIIVIGLQQFALQI